MIKSIILNIATLYILMCLILISCNTSVIYDQKQLVNDPWKYGDQLSFEYEVTDTVPAYNMIITIGHLPSFSYENIYLSTTTKFPDGTSTNTPVSFQLADNRGMWIGKCSGEKCSTEIEMSSGAFFKSMGKYVLIFDQFSREDSLTGIQSIGITVQKTKK